MTVGKFMLLLWLWLLWLGVLVGQEVGEERCFDYVLENECEYVVEGTSIPPAQQEGQFGLIAQSISDVRMIYSSCRRPLVWLTCVSAFDFDNCSNETRDEEDGGNRIYSWCKAVNEECDNLLNCTDISSLLSLIAGVPPPSSPPPSYSSYLPEFLDPIPVTTCQNGKEKIDCCFKPYLQDNDKECVIGCGQVPNYGDNDDVTLIVSNVIFFSGLVLTIIFVLPFFFTENFLKFPNYALPLSLFFQSCSIQIMFWTLYTGDPVDNYFCRGTISVAEAYDRLLSAWYCTTQFLFVGFFFIMTALWQTIVVILLINVACRNNPPHCKSFFLLFFDPKKQKKTQITCHLLFICFGLGVCIPGAVLAHEHELLGAAPPIFLCWVGGEGYALLIWVALLVPHFLVLIGLVFVILMLLMKNFILFKLHWRLVGYLIHNVCVFVIGNITIWYMSKAEDYSDRIVTYATCVAGEPNNDGVCSLEPGVTWYWLFSNTVFTSWPTISALIVYGTNPHFRRWWKHVILKRKIYKETLNQTRTKKETSSWNRSSSSSATVN